MFMMLRNQEFDVTLNTSFGWLETWGSSGDEEKEEAELEEEEEEEVEEGKWEEVMDEEGEIREEDSKVPVR